MHQLDVMVQQQFVPSAERVISMPSRISDFVYILSHLAHLIASTYLVILNPQSKLRKTLSIFAKYKTIKSFRSTKRQVNDAPSKQRNSARQNTGCIRKKETFRNQPYC